MPAPPRILFVSPWYREPGGVSTAVRQLVGYFGTRGHRPVLLLPGGGDAAPEADGVPGLEIVAVDLREPVVRSHPIRSRVGFLVRLPGMLLRLAALLRRHQIRTVNVHYPGPAHVAFAILKRLLPFRLVVSAHGSDLLPEGTAPPRRPVSVRWLLVSAEAIVVPSADYARRLAIQWGAGGPGVMVIPHGTRPPDPAGSGPPPALPACYVACVGSLRRVKGQDVLVRAFADVAAARPEVELVLVGDGPERSALDALCHELGLTGRVRLLGPLDPPHVWEVLRRARLVALPSRMESFGLVLLEAMACARAVVASRVGGVPEVVRDGETGLLVPADAPDDLARAILGLLADPAALERMGERGREVMERDFTVHRQGEAYTGVLFPSWAKKETHARPS